MLSTDLASLIYRQYGIKPQTVKLCIRGMHWTFEATTPDGRMFFKVFSADHELTQVLYEASVISALRLQGVGVAGIVLTRKGANAIRVEAEGAVRWGVLYEDAGGDVAGTCSQELKRFGYALKRLHGTPLDSLLLDTRRVWTAKAEQARICNVLLSSPLLGGKLATVVLKSYAPLWQVLNEDCLPRVLSHGDAWLGNVRVSNGQFTFFDLERACIAPPGLDLGTAAFHLNRDGPGLTPYGQAMTEGYAKDTGTIIDSGYLEAYTRLRALWSFTFLIGNRLLNAELLSAAIKRTLAYSFS